MSSWNFLTTEIKETDFLIDCRNQSSYEVETIINAYYCPFIKKAFGSDIESQKKMQGHIDAVIEKINLDKKNRVVVFDEGMGMYASRMAYLLKGAGLKGIYLFEGKWPLEGKKAKGVNIIEGSPVKKIKPLSNVVDRAFMEKNLTRVQIFDARTPEEYEGKIPRFTSPEPGSLCGRLPGSYSWDWRTLFNAEGMVIDKKLFNRRLKNYPFMPERATVIYDYNGARSCLLALMLAEVGYQEVYTYQGSWFEWRKTSLPKQVVKKFL